MKSYKIIITISLILSFTACKTTRSVTKMDAKTEGAVGQIVEKVKAVQPRFNSANVSKMSLELTMNERNVNVSATCKIKKDSVIYLSIQPFLGIEMFKVELMTDSVKVFDKMNRKYYFTDYGFFAKRFGVEVDFYSLQALLFAQFFCVGQKDLLTDSCRLVGTNKIEYTNKNIIQTTELSATFFIQQVLLSSKTGGYLLQTDYSDYSFIDTISFPRRIVLNASNQNSKATCVFSILKVDFNTDIKFIPSNPDRYALGSIDQILKK